MRVLIAVDYGLLGESQLEFLRSYGRGINSQFKIVHVVESAGWYLQAATPDMLPLAESFMAERRAAGEKLLIDVLDKLKDVCLAEKIEIEIREGNPANEIVNASEEWNADLILVGNYGKSGLERFLSGSVSQMVSTHASCSVLVARK